MVGIKYIGTREAHTDNLYGTALTWNPGQVHNVADDVAARMLAHADVYAEAKPVKGEEPATQGVLAKMEDPSHMLPNLDGMGKPDLIAFAQQHYNEKLHHAMSEENMRNKILTLIQANGRK